MRATGTDRVPRHAARNPFTKPYAVGTPAPAERGRPQGRPAPTKTDLYGDTHQGTAIHPQLFAAGDHTRTGTLPLRPPFRGARRAVPTLLRTPRGIAHPPGNTLRNRLDSLRRLCETRRHDRREHGHRATEERPPTRRIPKQTRLATPADHDRRRIDEHRPGFRHLCGHQLEMGRELPLHPRHDLRLRLQRPGQGDGFPRRRPHPLDRRHELRRFPPAAHRAAARTELRGEGTPRRRHGDVPHAGGFGQRPGAGRQLHRTALSLPRGRGGRRGAERPRPASGPATGSWD